ncbi:hypothetical protein [Lysinibacillus fusiformis]|uniref:hypothetical protein n=1 Tax=Lysinibacillus fusiformis TaxID=28031 RepID=UPI00215A2AA7|nr:hypothetical protein [Lysinibacillus fusiformis]MCR8852500.1 hypothetical protein [Lysinibacillus fusiformis]
MYPFVDEALPLIDGIIKHTVDTQNGVITATAETFFASVKKPTDVVLTLKKFY